MPKRLVICADGTWNEPEQEENGLSCATNVVKLASAVLPMDAKGMVQCLCYHAGVGERGGLWDHVSGGAFGVGISRNIEDLYLFLICNYEPGDELFLFGFSRGAYTVRSLAGLIRNSGILRKAWIAKRDKAYELYQDRSDESHPNAQAALDFRKQYAHPDFNVRCVGVWDTVGALGIPVKPLRFWTRKLYEFHDVELSSHVDFAFQALALDERRKPFQPSVWKQQPDSPATQVLEQAWFPGVHSDVGGGYAQCGLSDTALAWMWERAERAGLALDPRLRPQGDPAAAMHDSMTLFYRMMGNGERKPGESNPAGREELSQALRDRLARVAAYRPGNLEGMVAGGVAGEALQG